MRRGGAPEGYGGSQQIDRALSFENPLYVNAGGGGQLFEPVVGKFLGRKKAKEFMKEMESKGLKHGTDVYGKEQVGKRDIKDWP
jgi:hypothetical protein